MSKAFFVVLSPIFFSVLIFAHGHREEVETLLTNSEDVAERSSGVIVGHGGNRHGQKRRRSESTEEWAVDEVEGGEEEVGLPEEWLNVEPETADELSVLSEEKPSGNPGMASSEYSSVIDKRDVSSGGGTETSENVTETSQTENSTRAEQVQSDIMKLVAAALANATQIVNSTDI